MTCHLSESDNFRVFKETKNFKPVHNLLKLSLIAVYYIVLIEIICFMKFLFLAKNRICEIIIWRLTQFIY